MTHPDWLPPTVDPTVPSAARIYDYCVGGLHNFEVDRDMVRAASQRWPELPAIMRSNRAFLRRAVDYLAAAGVRQFLDIGSGIPTAGNVHEVAQRHNPDARVVYVDIDPVAVAMSGALLADNRSARVVQGDFTDIDAVLTHPDVRALLDFDEPVAVLMVALLHFVPDSAEPGTAIGRIRDVLSPGSYLALSHFSSDGPPEDVADVVAMSRATPTPLHLRPGARIASFFDGFTLVEPGLVELDTWRPDGDRSRTANGRFHDYAGVATLS
ncbi:MAG: hypothetical protein HOQ24_00665 [Mycobacteriaceae bacterium]|nr:hypothetical protein [Mycobacteriaceae bacterium]